jgi:hypothetical protein
MEKLYSATIEKFNSVEKNDLRVRFEIDLDSIYQILGIINEDYIYDLLTGIKYPILKKLDNGLIDQTCEVVTHKEYATNIEPFYENNIKELFYLQIAAKQAKKNIIKESQKVKVKK